MNRLAFFRCSFYLAIVVISYLAFAPLDADSFSTGWDKLNHALAFAVLLYLLDYSYPSQSLLVKLFMLALYAVLIEVVQGFLAYREFSLLDLIADGVGLLFYLCCRPYLLTVLVLKRHD